MDETLGVAVSGIALVSEDAAKSVTGVAVNVSVVSRSACADGMSRCSAALSGSSAVASALAVTSGVSNARSTTRSPVAQRQAASANQLMMKR